jgi:hypothetical protein
LRNGELAVRLSFLLAEETMLEKPTITIEHPDNPGESMIINKSDFNPEIHKLFKPKKQKATESDPDAGAEAAVGGTEVEAPSRRGRKKAAAADTDAGAESSDKAPPVKPRGRKKGVGDE